LIDAKFDFYNKACFAQIDLRIREKLNIFIKIKSFNKSAIVIKQQACFDNALNARNVYKLRLFKTNNTLAYNNNVYIITSIYHDN